MTQEKYRRRKYYIPERCGFCGIGTGKSCYQDKYGGIHYFRHIYDKRYPIMVGDKKYMVCEDCLKTAQKQTDLVKWRQDQERNYHYYSQNKNVDIIKQ